jgi:hypothetical protein
MAETNDYAINQFLMDRCGISDAHRKTSFVGWRRSKKVQVDIFDGTYANTDHRYYATATTEDGKTATGNDAPSPKAALENLSAYLTKLD